MQPVFFYDTRRNSKTSPNSLTRGTTQLNPGLHHLEFDGLEVVVADPDAVLEAVDGQLVGVTHRGPAALRQHSADLSRADVMERDPFKETGARVRSERSRKK